MRKEQGRLPGGGVFLALSSLGVIAPGKQWGNKVLKLEA